MQYTAISKSKELIQNADRTQITNAIASQPGKYYCRKINYASTRVLYCSAFSKADSLEISEMAIFTIQPCP